MLALLPILALGTFVLALKARAAAWREAILGGAVLWGVVLVGTTEGLSLIRGLTLAGLPAAWAVAVLVGGAAAVRGMSQKARWTSRPVSCGTPPDPAPATRPYRLGLRFTPPRIGKTEAALLGPLGVLVLVLGAIAIAGPPNTWDAMTYHMARVVHWTQNASLAPYPTHIPRQLYLQPGAEFALLHLQILSGGDHLAGSVQWASMVGALVGTSLIARDLGAGRRGILCATLFAASIPIGILESTSTQNDYVVAFWLVCVMFFAVRLTHAFGDAPPLMLTAAFGASIGLAVLAKATAYIIALPIVLWVTLCLVRRCGWRGLRPLVVAGAFALALNAGFYARNLNVFGTLVGPLDEGDPSVRYVNDAFAPPLLVSNLVRDIGLNFNATPAFPINVAAANFLRLVHVWLGVDIADPRTSWGQEHFTEQPIGLAFDENFASNPIHVLLIVLAMAAVWPLRVALPGASSAYAMVLSGGFVLFTVVLRWQPWHTRLELPFFVLAAPLVGTLAERVVGPRPTLLLASALLVSMLPWVAYNQARPLVGIRSILTVSRDDRYFANRPDIRIGYLRAVSTLVQRQCAQVGFISSADGWEYPLLPLLQGSVRGPVEIQHVLVANVSAAEANRKDERFQPCAVVAMGADASRVSLAINGSTYRPPPAELESVAPLDQVAVLTVDGR